MWWNSQRKIRQQIRTNRSNFREDEKRSFASYANHKVSGTYISNFPQYSELLFLMFLIIIWLNNNLAFSTFRVTFSNRIFELVATIFSSTIFSVLVSLQSLLSRISYISYFFILLWLWFLLRIRIDYLKFGVTTLIPPNNNKATQRSPDCRINA